MHRIRLRGPWTKTLCGSLETRRTSVPDSVVNAGELDGSAQPSTSEDVVVYERRFNRPSGLETKTLVLLSIEKWIGKAMEISVNGHQLLIARPPFEADITKYLELHNSLRVHLTGPPAALPCLDGEVALLIRDAND